MSDDSRMHTGYLVSAPWRSSGKTLITIGLARAAQRRSIAVQTFKKGPDYIDPLWLAAASGNGCYNLDPYVQCKDELLATFNNHTGHQSLALIEGTMGLHDGLSSDGADSNAAIAHILEVPVILVVDCRGMHRTVAALINGIQQFDPALRFAGVILNRIRSSRHEAKIQSAIDSYCDTQVLGVIPETRSIQIDEQELGLTPAPEFGTVSDGDCPTSQCINAAADLVADNCDLDKLFTGLPAATDVQSVQSVVDDTTTKTATIKRRQLPTCEHKNPLTIGLAKDEAFHFYYQDDLDTLVEQGVRLIELSPLRDRLPEDLDGLIIGGGFPERYAPALTGNHHFREALRFAIEQGLVVHAECAGLMYLCRSLLLESGHFNMVGCIAADVTIRKKPVGRGYVQLQRHGEDKVISAHEFHHSQIAFDRPPQYEYRILRGHGIDGSNDGVVCGNAHARYSHFRHTRANPWLDGFLQRVSDVRQERVAGGYVNVL